MKLNTHQTYKYFEKPGLPHKILVQAILTNSSNETRFFWLIFDWNDSQNKIIGILQKHWKITASEATSIFNTIEQLRNNKTPTSITTVNSIIIQAQSYLIMTDDGSGKRLILSDQRNKKFYKCKPRDKRWTWISNKLDPNKYSIPTKYDLLNSLGCSVLNDRMELIEQINLFYDSIKP